MPALSQQHQLTAPLSGLSEQTEPKGSDFDPAALEVGEGGELAGSALGAEQKVQGVTSADFSVPPLQVLPGVALP